MKSDVKRSLELPRISVVPSAPATTAPNRRKGRWTFGLAVVGVILTCAGVYALYASPWFTRPIAVAVETAEPGPVTRAIAVNGRVAARTSVEVAAGTTGRIVSVSVDQGDLVGIGDVLARQDDMTLQAVIRQAFAGLDTGIVRQQQAQSTVAADVALAGNIPQLTLEADTRLLAEADREVDRLQSLLDQAQSQLDAVTITSPMTGTILSRHVEVGQVADTQTVLFTMADLSHLVVQTDVDELYASQVKLGQTALLLPVGQTDALPGMVSRLSPLINVATGGMAIELSFASPLVLPLGMTVTANIVIDRRPDALTVSRMAIVPSSSIYRLEAGKAVLAPISIIDWPADRLIVTGGLAAGDVVITTPGGLSEGVRVVARQD